MQQLGGRLGLDPLELYRGENLYIVADLPESLRSLPADRLDAMLAALRQPRAQPGDRALNGPSLLDFLAERGGVSDPGGDLAARRAAWATSAACWRGRSST